MVSPEIDEVVAAWKAYAHTVEDWETLIVGL